MKELDVFHLFLLFLFFKESQLQQTCATQNTLVLPREPQKHYKQKYPTLLRTVLYCPITKTNKLTNLKKIKKIMCCDFVSSEREQ